MSVGTLCADCRPVDTRSSLAISRWPAQPPPSSLSLTSLSGLLRRWEVVVAVRQDQVPAPHHFGPSGRTDHQQPHHPGLTRVEHGVCTGTCSLEHGAAAFFVRLVKKKCGLRGGIGCGVPLGAAVNPLSHWTTTPCLAKLCWLCSCMCGWVGGRWVLEPCRESYRLGEASNSTTTTPHPNTHAHNPTSCCLQLARQQHPCRQHARARGGRLQRLWRGTQHGRLQRGRHQHHGAGSLCSQRR